MPAGQPTNLGGDFGRGFPRIIALPSYAASAGSQTALRAYFRKLSSAANDLAVRPEPATNRDVLRLVRVLDAFHVC
jgi:hypothetical protein